MTLPRPQLPTLSGGFLERCPAIFRRRAIANVTVPARFQGLSVCRPGRLPLEQGVVGGFNVLHIVPDADSVRSHLDRRLEPFSGHALISGAFAALRQGAVNSGDIGHG